MDLIFPICCKLDFFSSLILSILFSDQKFYHEEKEYREVIKNYLAQIMVLFPCSGCCPILSHANETFFRNDWFIECQSILQKQQSFTVNI